MEARGRRGVGVGVGIGVGWAWGAGKQGAGEVRIFFHNVNKGKINAQTKGLGEPRLHVKPETEAKTENSRVSIT